MKAQTTGHIPLGYKVVDKKLVIDDETRIIPETVFRMYAEGERLTDIAEHLNAQGYRNRRGRPFTTNSFYNMLANEKYIGIYKYDDIVIEGGIPQMIPNEVFEAVRKADNQPQESRQEHRQSRLLFVGQIILRSLRRAYERAVRHRTQRGQALLLPL